MKETVVYVDSVIKLIIENAVVQFAPTKVGQENIVMVKIKQLGATTPVILDVANTDRFMLSHNAFGANFRSNLYLIPSEDGSPVYIRYTPKSVWRYSSYIVVTTPYAVCTISLEGASIGLASLLPKIL